MFKKILLSTIITLLSLSHLSAVRWQLSFECKSGERASLPGHLLQEFSNHHKLSKIASLYDFARESNLSKRAILQLREILEILSKIKNNKKISTKKLIDNKNLFKKISKMKLTLETICQIDKICHELKITTVQHILARYMITTPKFLITIDRLSLSMQKIIVLRLFEYRRITYNKKRKIDLDKFFDKLLKLKTLNTILESTAQKICKLKTTQVYQLRRLLNNEEKPLAVLAFVFKNFKYTSYSLRQIKEKMNAILNEEQGKRHA